MAVNNLTDMQLAIRAAIYKMGKCFNKSSQPDPQQIEVYAEQLEKYSPDQIVFAFNQVIESGSAFFPSVAEIKNYLKPKVDSIEAQANTIASEIIQKIISDFGRYQIAEAIENMTPIARSVIERNRYFINELSDSTQDRLPMIRAQLRDVIKGYLERSKNDHFNQEAAKVGIAFTDAKILLMHSGPKRLQFENPKDEK